MMSKEGRIRFGSKPNFPKQVSPFFKYVGAQKMALAQNIAHNDEVVIPFIVQGRIRIKDLTCVNKQRAPTNSSVWIIWIRCKYEPVVDQWLSDKYDPRVSKSDYEKKQAGDPKKPKVIPKPSVAGDISAHHKAALAAMHSSTPGSLVAAVPVKEDDSHWWKPCIFFGHRGWEPPGEWYIDGENTGMAELLYTTGDMYGDSFNFQNQQMAREAMWPETDTSKWQESFLSLPDVDAYIGMR
jgi:hypothetical protein